jgi:hypothetical protein
MLQAQSLILAVVIVFAAYSWRRVGFRTPRILRVPPRVLRRAVVGVGYALVVWIIIYDIGGVLAGRTQIAQSGITYARLKQEPTRFWREIVLQTLVIAGTGGALIISGRSRRADAVRRDA